MSTIVLTDCTAWVDGTQLTTNTNSATLSVDIEDKDATCFGGGGWKVPVAGLRNFDCALKGLQDDQAVVDADAWNNLGVSRVTTLTPTGAAAGPAYFFQARNFAYERFGSVGEIDPFSLKIKGSDGVGVVRGQVAAAVGSVSATGQLGSVLNLGAPTSTQYVYAAFHVFSAPTTITVQVQSDDNSGMTSPTTRGTIGPITVAGGTWLTRVAGPFAGETHWRLNVSAITGTASVAGAIAVQ